MTALVDFCYCQNNFDVRCFCNLNEQSFHSCPMQNSTIYFMITNDYDTFNYYENHKKGFSSIKSRTMKKYKINEKDLDEILDLYNSDNSDDSSDADRRLLTH